MTTTTTKHRIARLWIATSQNLATSAFEPEVDGADHGDQCFAGNEPRRERDHVHVGGLFLLFLPDPADHTTEEHRRHDRERHQDADTDSGRRRYVRLQLLVGLE